MTVAYHQMGYQSENLLSEPWLAPYAGAILSPADYEEAALTDQVARRQSPDFECIFDPQLYYPNTYRERLQGWSYFPQDVETADPASTAWWSGVNARFVEAVQRSGARAACSPAIVARNFNLDYLRMMTEVGDEFSTWSEAAGIEALQTAIVPQGSLLGDGALAVASVLAASKSARIFLVLLHDFEPRREIEDVASITGGLRLIAELQAAGLHVTLGFCGTDVLLYSAAGADICATGKFFNLRRFTGSRFEEPTQGGRQLPYFCEESLLAFLREQDVSRLLRANFSFSGSTGRNPYVPEILEIIREGTGRPWLGLGWKQFMWWFADVVGRVPDGRAADAILADAESRWMDVGDLRPRVLMAEPRNTGYWLRPWRLALSDAGLV